MIRDAAGQPSTTAAHGTGSGSTPPARSLLPRFLMGRVFPIALAILLQFQPACAAGLFLNPVVAVPAGGAFQPNILTHDDTAPALAWDSAPTDGGPDSGRCDCLTNTDGAARPQP